MHKPENTVVLVTGASTGIGMACANHLAEKGYKVYGTSRDISKLNDPSFLFKPIELNIDESDSVKQAVKEILRNEDKIDVIVNNAGYALMGAVEDTSIEEAKKTFETNFFGILRLCNEVLPGMRKRKSGKIINISSIGGKMGLPFRGIYCASKFALEGMSESLRMELDPFGIKVIILEPGDTKTDINNTRVTAKQALNGSPYNDLFNISRDIIHGDIKKGSPPHLIAKTIEKIITSRSPRLLYRVGYTHQKLVIPAKKILPPGLFEMIIKKLYKLT